MNQRVVMISGGVTSTIALVRAIASVGAENVTGLFCDTLTEDEDLYRFLADIERIIHPVTRIAEGRNIWEVFRDGRMIGNNGKDICSRVLKRELSLRWLKANAPDAKVVLGLDWSEPHRIAGARARWSAAGFDTEFPLDAAPHLFKSEYMAQVRALGIDPPRLYAMGFEHNNCGGFCVKGGQGQMARLLALMPERYAYHENQEELTRQHIGKDVAVMKDRAGGETRPLTMRAFRERIEAGHPPMDDIFSCNCMS